MRNTKIYINNIIKNYMATSSRRTYKAMGLNGMHKRIDKDA